MDTSTDSTQQQFIPGTDNPQAVSTPAGASDSKDFQQSAGAEALQQQGMLQVINQGTPIQGGTTVARPASAYIPLVLVIFAIVLVSSRLIRWVKAAPAAAPALVQTDKPAAANEVALVKPVTAKMPVKKSKKTSRAKRRNK